MARVVLRIIINAFAISLTALLLPGIEVLNNDVGSFFLLGITIAIVNGVVRPIIAVLTCPFTILTLGLFIFVINGMMLMLVQGLLPDRLYIDNFGWAVLGGILMGITNLVVEGLFFSGGSSQGGGTRVVYVEQRFDFDDDDKPKR